MNTAGLNHWTGKVPTIRPASNVAPSTPCEYAVRLEAEQERMAAEIVRSVLFRPSFTKLVSFDYKTPVDLLVESLDVSSGTHHEVMLFVQRIAKKGNPEARELVEMLAREFAKANVEAE